jgi:hypothetical protein
MSFELDMPHFSGDPESDDPSIATLGQLRITAGDTCFTRVDDTVARSVRDHVFLGGWNLALWLVQHWWRIRWEPRREGGAWLEAHTLAAIGAGEAWPDLRFSSDGDFVQLEASPENARDAAAIRYLRGSVVEVPASEFEQGVDRFLDTVEGRVASHNGAAKVLHDLRAELAAERMNPTTATLCRLEARSAAGTPARPRKPG